MHHTPPVILERLPLWKPPARISARLLSLLALLLSGTPQHAPGRGPPHGQHLPRSCLFVWSQVTRA
jgi:hypothetical protein